MNKKKQRENYELMFKKIRTVINKYDPAGLEPGATSSHTPEDEYDAEVGKITAFVEHNLEDIKLRPAILAQKIKEIWLEAFEEDCHNLPQITNEIISNVC